MKAHFAYLNYVIRHKWFVLVAGRTMKVPLWRLLIHDWSKFLPCEWFPYVRSFYNPNGSKRIWKNRDPWDKMEFDVAWNHHQKANKHHWQYWILINDSDEPQLRPQIMPEKYWREMIADWMAAGRAITGEWEVWEWYAKNRDKIILHEQIRKLVDLELESLKRTKDLASRLGFSFP